MKKTDKEIKKKRLTTKQKIALIINFIIALGIYYTCVYFAEYKGNILPYQICSGAYITIALILAAASLVLSGKVVKKNSSAEPCEKDIKLAKSLLLVALPLFVVLLIDFLDLFVVQYIKEGFESLT